MGRNEKKKYMKKESQLLLIIVCYFNDIGRSSSSLIHYSAYIVCRMAFCSIFPSPAPGIFTSIEKSYEKLKTTLNKFVWIGIDV